MRATNLVKAAYGVLLFSLVTACGNSPESTCEASCEYANRCLEASADCAEDSEEMKECVAEIEKLSDDCQSAAGDFIECANDADSCDSAELAGDCGEELGDYIEACAGEDPVGGDVDGE